MIHTPFGVYILFSNLPSHLSNIWKDVQFIILIRLLCMEKE